MGVENQRLPRSISIRSLQAADEGNRLSRPDGETPRHPVYDAQLEYDKRNRQSSARRDALIEFSMIPAEEDSVRICRFAVKVHDNACALENSTRSASDTESQRDEGLNRFLPICLTPPLARS